MKSKQEVKRELDLLKSSISNYSQFDDLSLDVVDCICNSLEIERCSIWRLDESEDFMRCELVLEVNKGVLREPTIVRQIDYPIYFKHLLMGKPIVASNARKNEATAEFKSVYLVPNNIYSLLDVPIFKGNKIQGIICCEQCETIKQWQPEEQDFVKEVAELITPFF